MKHGIKHSMKHGAHYQPKKKVRFDDDVEYNIYKKYSSSHSSSHSNSPKCLSSIYDDTKIDSISTNSSISDVSGENDDPNYKIHPSNLEQIDPEDTWDASFGLPLMSKEEKNEYFNKMQQNFKTYSNAVDDFGKYQMDRSTVIETDVTINPFKPDHRSHQLKGKPIKEIYDEQVAGPKAKPKKIKSITNTGITYDDESELNGGKLMGGNLIGFDGVTGSHKSASFGNEF
jgi:hypothetical protein